MINNPKIMMLDEPFRGLDAMTRELMQRAASHTRIQSEIACLNETAGRIQRSRGHSYR